MTFIFLESPIIGQLQRVTTKEQRDHVPRHARITTRPVSHPSRKHTTRVVKPHAVSNAVQNNDPFLRMVALRDVSLQVQIVAISSTEPMHSLSVCPPSITHPGVAPPPVTCSSSSSLSMRGKDEGGAGSTRRGGGDEGRSRKEEKQRTRRSRRTKASERAVQGLQQCTSV